MAIGEGWIKNPKYKTMAKQMISYRAAMNLIRLYAPEVLLGITVDVEVESESKTSEGINRLNEELLSA